MRNPRILALPNGSRNTANGIAVREAVRRAASSTSHLVFLRSTLTNEIDVAHRLDAHHARQPAAFLIAPEHGAGGDLAVQCAASM